MKWDLENDALSKPKKYVTNSSVFYAVLSRDDANPRRVN